MVVLDRYRRAKKKEKEKQAAKELEELAVTDPQALVDKMEEADRKRIEVGGVACSLALSVLLLSVISYHSMSDLQYRKCLCVIPCFVNSFGNDMMSKQLYTAEPRIYFSHDTGGRLQLNKHAPSIYSFG